ncbi:ligase [Vibrio sp. HA2012]|uniref:PglL family O-oligosaccharyltransferase n=1 Tax=Vibrio sp. HA2012 TaxID=1971595 RepID=UPI000C2C6B65|nr:PglL family O-oligosaccharyltransferase [Vibrio sp. HA2012]PJC85574.1 ligase [Vibrio sp. HA2012]
MAIIHFSGTQLEPIKASAPLNRKFMFAFGFIFIIAMHFFMPNPGGTGIDVPFNAASWIGLSLALAIGLFQTANNQKLRFSRLTIGLFLCVLIISLPILYANAASFAALPRLSGLWSGFLLFLLLQQFQLSNKYKQQLLWMIVLATLIESVLGYIQFLLLPADNHFAYDVSINRPYGIFQQPDVMASFLATGMLLSGYLLARQQRKYGRKVTHVSLLYLVPSLTLPLIVVLASRTGWIGAVLGVLTILPYLLRFSTRKRLLGWGISVLVGISAGLILGSTSEQTTKMITEQAGLQSERLQTLPQTLDMLIERPFTGYGYGRFEAAYMLYTARQHQLNPAYPSGMQAMEHPHNELLFWGVEGGLIPVLGIMLTAGLVLLKIYSARKGTRLAMLGLFIPLVLHTQLASPFYHSVMHWVIFIVLLFWVDQRTATYYFQPFSRVARVVLKLTAVLLPLCISAYMLTALHTNYVLTRFEQSGAHPAQLSGVSNPFAWKERYERDTLRADLLLGLQDHNPALIQPYIDWSQDIIREKPRAELYADLILAYLGMGEQSKARQVETEARLLFPEFTYSQEKEPVSEKNNPAEKTER